MALYEGENKLSSQITMTQYTDVSEIMKYMNTEVGDIGQVMLPLNENENRRRYLNGQLILMEQFPKFTDKLKEAVKLYPSLACTEAEWQAYRKNNADNQCGKFVIDNTNGTIRLPRIKYLSGNLDLYKMAEGIPNRRLVKQQRPTDSNKAWYNLYSDGWLEQGGRGNTANNTVTITLPIAYKDLLYSVTAGCNTNGAYASPTACNILNAQQIQLRCGGTTEWMWKTQGYTTAPNINQQYSTNDNVDMFESPYYIQVATGVDYEVDVTNKLTTNNPYSFGMYQRSVSPLNNLSWIKSNGAMYDGNMYPEFYNWVLNHYNNHDEVEVCLLNKCFRYQDPNDAGAQYNIAYRNPKLGDPVYGNSQGLSGYITNVIDADNFTFYDTRTAKSITLRYLEVSNTSVCTNDTSFVLDTEHKTFRLPLAVGDEMVPDYSVVKNPTFPINPITTTVYTYIAPYNGYLCMYLYRSTAGNTTVYYLNDVHYGESPAWAANYENLYVPMKRGDRFKIVGNSASATWIIGEQRFIKAINPSPLYFYVGEVVQDAHLVDLGKITDYLDKRSPRYIIAKSGDSTNGYNIYNDGWCEQWGYFGATGADTLTTVTLHLPMRDNRYQVHVNMQYAGDGTASWQYLNAKNLTIKSFQTMCQSATYHNWRVIGYMA